MISHSTWVGENQTRPMGLRAAPKEPLGGQLGRGGRYFFHLEEALSFPCLHPVRSAVARACAPWGGWTSFSILHPCGDRDVAPLATPEPGPRRAPLAAEPCSPGPDTLPLAGGLCRRAGSCAPGWLAACRAAGPRSRAAPRPWDKGAAERGGHAACESLEAGAFRGAELCRVLLRY